MPESFRSRLYRWYFNFFPAYRGTGARITYLADDFREIRVRLPLSRRTRNYVGTIFGGSMYAAVDPIYMVMLIHNLGADYQVWDKAATIRFRKPGRSTLYARFLIDERELADIQAALALEPATERVYDVDLTDDVGTVHASVRKTVHIRRRESHERAPA
jgi:acyl-coenzyme A thioesterase PaaI-like protein